MKNSYIEQQLDRLTGNINRMCVTDSREELDHMAFWATKRIYRILDAREKELNEHLKKELEK